MVSWSKEEIVHLLTRVQKTIETIERRNQTIQSVHDYLLNENRMEKLDAACMLIQTIGENIKTINEKQKVSYLFNILKFHGKEWLEWDITYPITTTESMQMLFSKQLKATFLLYKKQSNEYYPI